MNRSQNTHQTFEPFHTLHHFEVWQNAKWPNSQTRNKSTQMGLTNYDRWQIATRTTSILVLSSISKDRPPMKKT
eukprot:05893.XXX_35917_36138_1 [CDS] Oithona nana genome sequencing.